MAVSVLAIPVGQLQSNAYLVVSAGEAIVVDPGAEPKRIEEAIRRAGVGRIAAIALTHGHFDHVGAVAELRTATRAPVLLHPADLSLYREAASQARLFGCPSFPVVEPDRALVPGGGITFGGVMFTVLHTPGHTPGGVCFLGEGHLLSGDTLFAGSVGRTDFPGGSSRELMEAIRSRLLPLPDAVVVHPGHGPSSTIGREKRANPFLSGWR